MATVTARALEVAFRHLAEPVRWWQGPEEVQLAGVGFSRGANVLLEPGDAPSWSKLEPTGFEFSYLLADEEERRDFFQHSCENVSVRLFRAFRGVNREWAEQAKWRFEGVISGATWDTGTNLVRCPVVPISRTQRLQPHVGLWSHRTQLAKTDGRDTGFRWMRGKRKVLELFPKDVSE